MDGRLLARAAVGAALALLGGAGSGCGEEVGGTGAASGMVTTAGGATAAATSAAATVAAGPASAATAAVPPEAGGGAPAGAGPTLRWYGQSAFLVTTPKGTRILMDPIPPELGYALPPPVEAHVVTVSHEHFDHTNVAMAGGTPEVLRGLTKDKAGWEAIDRTVGDVRVRAVGTWHDEKLGKERGLNAVFVLEFDGWRVVHLGDLGHLLTPEQVAAIGPVDVLLIPVGGTFTIDHNAASKVIEQLAPRTVIIPMHYKTPALKPDLPLAPVTDFVAGKSKVRLIDASELKVTARPAGEPAEIVIMGYL